MGSELGYIVLQVAWVRRSLLTRRGAARCRGVIAKGVRGRGGGVISGRFCPKLGQRLGCGGVGGTKGRGAQVCRQCVLRKAAGGVREVKPQESAFSSGSRNLPLPIGNAVYLRVGIM